jgi:hypothetical protein
MDASIKVQLELHEVHVVSFEVVISLSLGKLPSLEFSGIVSLVGLSDLESDHIITMTLRLVVVLHEDSHCRAQHVTEATPQRTGTVGTGGKLVRTSLEVVGEVASRATRQVAINAEVRLVDASICVSGVSCTTPSRVLLLELFWVGGKVLETVVGAFGAVLLVVGLHLLVVIL